jgi:hypothetical protein
MVPTMATSKKIFREAILSKVLPILDRIQFEQWKPKNRAEVPIVYLRRRVAGRTDLIEIQFDKYGRLACFVNIGQVRGREVETRYEGVMDTDQVTAAHLRESCRLRGNSFFGMFKPPLYVRILGPERSGMAVADQIAARLPEAEQWFQTKHVGKHIKCYKL